MFDAYGPAPIDSYDLYAMGLRQPRCNGCMFARLQHDLGERCLVLIEEGWPTVYELDAEPRPGQERQKHQGRPIRFHASFMGVGHSDECYNWQPHGEEGELYTIGGAKVRLHVGEDDLEFRIVGVSTKKAFYAALEAFKNAIPDRRYDPDTRTWHVPLEHREALEALTRTPTLGVRRPGFLRRLKAFIQRMIGD